MQCTRHCRLAFRPTAGDVCRSTDDGVGEDHTTSGQKRRQKYQTSVAGVMPSARPAGPGRTFDVTSLGVRCSGPVTVVLPRGRGTDDDSVGGSRPGYVGGTRPDRDLPRSVAVPESPRRRQSEDGVRTHLRGLLAPSPGLDPDRSPGARALTGDTFGRIWDRDTLEGHGSSFLQFIWCD